MEKYSVGDRVRFKGDDVEYIVTRVWDDYRNGSTYDLDPQSPGLPPEGSIESVPPRLLESVKPEVRVGQVWEDVDPVEGPYRAFVTRVEEGRVMYITEWDFGVSTHPVKWFQQNHSLILDAR